MALRKVLVQFSELVFVALALQICAALANVQPAQPSLRMSSAFPNVGGALVDTQGSCTLQRKFEWTELPAVLAEGLLRLHELELELIQPHMAQKPVLGGEVGARVCVIRACGQRQEKR